MKKMSATARSWLGKQKQCVECGEGKTVALSTYALLNADPTGWHSVCRACQTAGPAASPQDGVADVTPIAETMDSEDELINEMYYLGQTGRDPDRLAEIVAELSRRVREAKTDEESFFTFMRAIQPLIAGWREPGAIHGDILKGLLHGDLRTLIIATRFSAKSTLTSIYVAWVIFRDPLIKILVISRGSKLAARMLRTVRRVYIENCPMLWHLRPTEHCLDNAEQYQAPQAIDVATGGITLTSVGVTSNLPGLRSDLTIGDDVEGPQEDTPEKVTDLMEMLNELHMINPKGRKIMLGTFQSEFSMYAQYADQVDEEGTAVWDMHRACMFQEEGKYIYSRWPEMFSDAQALDWRRSVTARAWRLHAMLIADPNALRDRPLKIRDLPIVALPPLAGSAPLRYQLYETERKDLPTWGAPRGDVWSEAKPGEAYAPYAATVVAVDPASGLAGRDAIGVTVLSVTASGFGIIRAIEGVRAPSKAEAVARVAEITRAYRATMLVVEELADGFFGSTLEGILALSGYPMAVEQVTSGGVSKGRRIIETLSPVMSTGRLMICEEIVPTDNCAEFVTQMVQIAWDRTSANSKGSADDIVDSLAHAVGRVKPMLTGQIEDNLAGVYAERLADLATVPLRDGGLKEADAATITTRYGTTVQGVPQSYAQALQEEDLHTTRARARCDAWRDEIETLLRRGVEADPEGAGQSRLLHDLQGRLARTLLRLKDAQEMTPL